MLQTVPAWDLDVERGPDWLLVKIKTPENDLSAAPSLADQLWSLMERHFIYRLVLEMDDVEVLQTYLIGQLVMLHKRIRDHDGVIRLCGLSPYNRKVLRSCRLDDRLQTYGNRVEAVLGCLPHNPK